MGKYKLNKITSEKLKVLKEENPDLIVKELYTLAGAYTTQKRVVPAYEREDVIQILVTKAWHVLDKFDDTRAGFTSFIYKVYENEIKQYYRKKSAKKRACGGLELLDREIKTGDQNILYMDLIPDPNTKDTLTEIIETGYLEDFKNLLEPLTLEYINGAKQHELAEKYGVTQAMISRKIKKNIKKAKEQLKAKWE